MLVANVELLLAVAKKMTFLPRNLEEFTTPPEMYDALPENMAELRYAMYDKIDYALSLGVFTEQEASDWREGFEACTETEYMESLVEVIDDFIDSGWAIVSEIEDLLATGEINDGEKNSFLIQMGGMDYQDKIELCRNLEKTLNEVSRDKIKLKLILTQNNIDKAAAVTLEKNFTEAAIGEKSKVIQQAEKVAKNQEVKGDTQTAKRLRKIIDLQIQSGNLKQARQTLEGGFPKQLSYEDYVRFDAQIIQMEISFSQSEAYKVTV